LVDPYRKASAKHCCGSALCDLLPMSIYLSLTHMLIKPGDFG